MIQEAMLFRELSSKEQQQQQAEDSKPKKHNKKDKKKKRKRDSSSSSSAEPREVIVVDDDDQSPHNHKEEPQPPPSDDNKTPKDSSSNSKDKKQTRAERKARKQSLKDRLPKEDEHGIAYTKQQLRKMLKRVQRGLSPIPTPQEAHELRVQEAQLKKQEELELADMLYDTNTAQKKQSEELDGGDDEDEEDHDGDDEGGNNAEHDNDDDDDGKPMDQHDDSHDLSSDATPPPAKRAKPSSSSSKKPVPSDYICQACQNRHQPAHWIYHCPDKVTMRGSNHVSASKQQHHDGMPSAKKVFVSGLPFDATPKTVKELLGNDQHKVTSVQLLKFPDTGRCKGQAFVCFDSEAGAHAALTMSGTKLEHSSTTPDTKKKSVTPEPTPKKELVLKVSKVQSRYITKQRKQQPHH